MYQQTLSTAYESVRIHSLQSLKHRGIVNVDDLPFTMKILLESLMRNQSRLGLTEQDLIQVARRTRSNEPVEIPFLPTRVIMQDASGVPALVDMVSFRQRMMEEGINPSQVNPAIPVDLVIDHSVQVDYSGSESAFSKNLHLEYERNQERYEFLKWAQQSFKGFRVIPPANGIIHQVNLECLTKVVQLTNHDQVRMAHPEIIIGTDSHTTMVNALGVLGWGVGGIEAEAAMLGIPVSISVPEVVGVEITGQMNEGVTATDVALTITQLLRKHNVVGKFVEFFGPGLKRLSLPDRATIANMAPEYGATCGFFPVDEETLTFLRMTGKRDVEVNLVEQYCKEQGLFHTSESSGNRRVYSDLLTFDLQTVEASVSGPRRPQDRMPIREVRKSFPKSLSPIQSNGTNTPSTELKDGSIVIAAITSCTNTSNPVNMIGAGLLAKKAVEYGLTVPKSIQTSLAPGSKAVTGYLQKAGLLPYLEKLGFYHAGYGCAVCVGNSGKLDEEVEKSIKEQDLTVAAVLSGNRNFEGRIHALVKANYLVSPPLVIAFALAGTMDIDMESEPLGRSISGKEIYLKDIWPSSDEIASIVNSTISSEIFREAYEHVFEGDERWQSLEYEDDPIFKWNDQSTYFKASPFFKAELNEHRQPGEMNQAKVLLMVGDSITTDHISPVGQIPYDSTAGKYLMEQDVELADFNSYGSRRGNYEVLVRGTFAHPRLKNKLVDKTGGYTLYVPSGEEMDVYSASIKYQQENTPLIILAGKDYGMGSARDWAAKGTYLLGVKAVIAESFERIHRSNLAMMGIVPLQFMPGENYESLNLTGLETFSIIGLNEPLSPFQEVMVVATKENGSKTTFQTVLRLDTRMEIELYMKKGIFQSILGQWEKSLTR
ncbi:aconitate hydratase AcnA [Niallia endozanthoxylica]|uniref:Aconitate hydratase n=1 Tax=Niallia endozanthoxylica TaxID=2036016 RepID=A0A5J5I789_9BACI|nr:aconitate hydratase AcnA [Niallia endozanthoxylica]KAA9031680.1 aconitate hydratase AcnA [Niallia endozanthoxylica]